MNPKQSKQCKIQPTLRPKLLYVFEIRDEAHQGCVKVGDATVKTQVDIHKLTPNCSILNEAAHDRIDQYTRTAGINYRLLYTECLWTEQGGKLDDHLRDHEVHNILKRSQVPVREFDTLSGKQKGKSREWFCCDLETVKAAIRAAKSGKTALDNSEVHLTRLDGTVVEASAAIVFREEQEQAIKMTLQRFKKQKTMLWDAKMRFGKTLTALEVVRRAEFHRTLIITHRPVVLKEWADEFPKVFYGANNQWRFGSRTIGSKFQELEADAVADPTKHYIYFMSIQDLRGSDKVGGDFDKNQKEYKANWDLIIIDEAHEGTQTELGQSVIDALKKENTRILNLSGTPFNLLDQIDKEGIFTWTYVDEQNAKQRWYREHPNGEDNPYADLPTLNIRAFDLQKLLQSSTTYIDFENDMFSFKEFWRTNDEGKFLHEADVRKFLDLLTSNPDNHFPFSTKEYRDDFRHSLWMLPGVAAAKALSTLLKNHPVFENYNIVNVAGEGDEEAAFDDAKKAVLDAIGDYPDQTRTITLSCGRLTTGVTIKPWTAVFMLAGGSKTDAKSYMQTIFRVQSPFKTQNYQKEECFAFDFAPDRALTMVTLAAKANHKAGKTHESDREILKATLNFLPIIAYDGTEFVEYDVENMFRQLKRIYIDRAIRSGFDDNSIYTDALTEDLTEEEKRKFENLNRIVGRTKAQPKSQEVEIAKNGLDKDEEQEITILTKKKNKKELTPEEEARLAELRAKQAEKRKQRETLISNLRAISIRVPLLAYGAVKQGDSERITMESLPDLVDDASWCEFMPQGVTKDIFRGFLRYYDEDIVGGATERIRNFAKSGDSLFPEERIQLLASIFANFRNPDKETVLTPWRVVNQHLASTVGGYCFFDEAFKKELDAPRFIHQPKITNRVFGLDKQILEINSKSGLYPLYMAYTLYCKRKERYLSTRPGHSLSLEESQRLWQETVEQNIFVVCKTEMARDITQRTLLGFTNGKAHLRYITDLINRVQNDRSDLVKNLRNAQRWNLPKSASTAKHQNDMLQFSAVVGNPPYQIENEGDGNGKNPIYHLFYDLGFELADIVTLITPRRFLYNAGSTPKEWNKKMLNDEHIQVILNEANSQAIFNNVDIKGGVAILLRDANQILGPIGHIFQFPEMETILSKVTHEEGEDYIGLNTIVSPQGLYKLTPTFYEENPTMKGRQSKGADYLVVSNIFSIFPEFFTAEKPQDGAEYAQVYGRAEKGRTFRWVKKAYITHPDSFSKYKVFVPKSNGTGAIGEILSTPMIGQPMIGHTQTFLSIGCFDTKKEAEACLKYIKTKFCRMMLGLRKVTQDNMPDTWAYIPLQDFTAGGSLDWSQSVQDIDRQLYKMYGLDQAEIDFIETNIREML